MMGVIPAAMLMLVALPLAAGCCLALLLPRKHWVWTYDMILICLGIGVVVLLPVCIPLLIFWTRPQTKAWFSPN
jgi:hypothetical protein